MSFDDEKFRRIILNYRAKCEYEENLRLFICIFKIGPIETVQLMFNLTKKIGKKFAIKVWLLKNLSGTLFCTIIGILFCCLL